MPRTPRTSTPQESASLPRVAVLIPCYQEEQTVAKVVRDFSQAIPHAKVYVYDNNSADATVLRATEAGAIVRREKRQGKGFVVATMLEDVEADFYVIVDGDDTYDARSVDKLVQPLLSGDADMTVGSRLNPSDPDSFRRFHMFGNRLVCRVINSIFRSDIHDIFSGYRAMTRAVAKSVPVLARGFDVETELTLQTLYRQFVIREIPTPYSARPAGSHSKLRTLPDGARVLFRLFLMLQSYKPLTFFGSIGILAVIASALSGFRPVLEYIEYEYVYSVPRAVLAAALAVISLLSVGIGLILHSNNYRLREVEKVLVKRTAAVNDGSRTA